MSRIALLVALLAHSACTHLEPLTVAPAGQHADIDNGNDTIALSRGVAVAFTCVSAWGNRCEGTPRVDDPNIALVYPAHLERLEWFPGGKFEPTSFVIVGVSGGRTALRIPNERTMRVIVSE